MIEAMGEGVDAELEGFEAGREIFDAVELGEGDRTNSGSVPVAASDY